MRLPRLQFAMRHLLLAPIAAAVVMGIVVWWIRLNGLADEYLARAHYKRSILDAACHSRVAWVSCFWLSVLLARLAGPRISRPWLRVGVWCLIAIASAALPYLAWARSRYPPPYMSFHDLDAGFPYPDQFILALERWLDPRYSASPRYMRGFQESHRVCLTLGLLVMIVAGLAGLLMGSLANLPPARQRLLRGSPG
jgi:hypothetical protein